MALQTKTLSVLLDEIKREARVKGSDNLDTFITTLINELLLDYAEKTRYFELLLREQPIVLSEAESDYDLPDDFHKMRAVRYTIGSGIPFSLYPRGQYVPQTSGGNPRFYEVAGTTLTVMPATNVKDNDTLVLDYYKYPTELVSDGDIFPIPRLIGPLKLKAIYRVVLYNRELNVASALRGESMEQEYRSAVPIPRE
jgi:hypothetical protein